MSMNGNENAFDENIENEILSMEKILKMADAIKMKSSTKSLSSEEKYDLLEAKQYFDRQFKGYFPNR